VDFWGIERIKLSLLVKWSEIASISPPDGAADWGRSETPPRRGEMRLTDKMDEYEIA